MMPTSVAPASELPWQKSDCKTFLPTHRAAAPSSADDAERACISEAITVLCADWRAARALHVHQDQSTARAAVDAPASHACSTCTLRACEAADTKGTAALVTEHVHTWVRATTSSMATVTASGHGATSSVANQRPTTSSSYHNVARVLRTRHRNAVDGRGRGPYVF